MGRPPRGQPKKLIGFLVWQEEQREDPDGEPPPALTPDERIAQQIWNLLGGCEWSGFELACELFGVKDPLHMAQMLAAIRDGLNDLDEQKRNRSS